MALRGLLRVAAGSMVNESLEPLSAQSPTSVVTWTASVCSRAYAGDVGPCLLPP